jgi:FKBP-type peptidyl-prolyl cis-trans isomerase SlyD
MHGITKEQILNIANDHVVLINYTLTNDGGDVIDTSDGREPLGYIHGKGHIIPGLENALTGKTKGDKLDVSIAPADGYGDRNDQLIQEVPKTQFENSEQIQVGMQFQVQAGDVPMIFTAVEVKDDTVVMDGNHPLAGQTLNFAVEVMEVRQATEEELSHDHVHGTGGVTHEE